MYLCAPFLEFPSRRKQHLLVSPTLGDDKEKMGMQRDGVGELVTKVHTAEDIILVLSTGNMVSKWEALHLLR